MVSMVSNNTSTTYIVFLNVIIFEIKISNCGDMEKLNELL